VTTSKDSNPLTHLEGPEAALARLDTPSRVMWEAGDDCHSMAARRQVLGQIAGIGCDAGRLGTVVNPNYEDVRH
jgi:hypothetical protein